MAKRKPKKDDTNASKIALTASNAHPMQSLFKLIVMGGSAKQPGDLVAPYDVGDNIHLSIAIPHIKFGIAFEGDKTQDLEDDGWHIQRLASRDIEPFARVFFAAEYAHVADLYSRSDPNVKTTSHAEEKLFTEIIRRGMPVPDRNLKFKRDDGTELTTPDFSWEEYQIAFFMDGSYWHSVKDDQQIIKEIKKSKKMQDSIVDKRKDKVRKDGAIRSELGALGWIVLSCTDDDLSTPAGVHEVVDLIERTLRKAEASRQFKQKVAEDHSDMSLITGLLAESPDDYPDMPQDTPSIGEDSNSVDDGAEDSPVENTGTTDTGDDAGDDITDDTDNGDSGGSKNPEEDAFLSGLLAGEEMNWDGGDSEDRPEDDPEDDTEESDED